MVFEVSYEDRIERRRRKGETHVLVCTHHGFVYKTADPIAKAIRKARQTFGEPGQDASGFTVADLASPEPGHSLEACHRCRSCQYPVSMLRDS